uniref:PiggyBac transposable element-derived protein domain-containing protein n=1 Tax=Oryzias latipes TaxID=8090 RepID=A0A3P9MFQ0_ORYLA
MGPSTKRKRLQPAVEVLQDSGSDSYSEDNDDDDNEQPAPQAKRLSKPSKSAVRPTTWHKADLKNTALPEYQHSTPDCIDLPFQYFTRYFDDQIIRHITYQTNLYAAQKDINTTFTTNENEILTFVTILIYMGIVELPSVDDYWARKTNVPQVANLMSSKRFKLLKRVIHFNNNTRIYGTSDRFFKIRPLFSFINTAFRRESQTPKQSVDEVMVAYKGKKAGNLRQYIKSKPDKWGFKLFARASEDGFIHDMPGRTELESLHSGQSRRWRKRLCLMVPVTVTSDDGILAVRWKDNKTVTFLSTDMGVAPMSTVIRYCSETKKREPVSCPAVIRSYNDNMRGIDKSDMLVHLYRTPMKSKRWYLRLFTYIIDVSLTNAWVVYKRDCKALGVKCQPLKDFRLKVFRDASNQMPAPPSSRRSSSSFVESLTSSTDVPKPIRGHRSHTPNLAVVCKVHLCMNSERNCFVKYHEEFLNSDSL